MSNLIDGGSLIWNSPAIMVQLWKGWRFNPDNKVITAYLKHIELYFTVSQVKEEKQVRMCQYPLTSLAKKCN